jgi:hypothetical protein
VRDCTIRSAAFSHLFQLKEIESSLRIRILKLLAVVLEYPEPPPSAIVGQELILQFVLDSVSVPKNKVISAACFSLFRLATFDDGRLLLIAHEIPSLFVSLLDGASCVFANHLIWVLGQIALSDQVGIVEAVLQAGFMEVVTTSLEGLDQKALQIALDALLNIERIGYVTGREEFAEAIYSNANLVGALANLAESSQEAVWESANSLYTACIRSDRS